MMHNLTNVRTKCQPSIPYGIQEIAQIFKRMVTMTKSNQGHTMTSHTYNPQPMSLPRINFLHLLVYEI